MADGIELITPYFPVYSEPSPVGAVEIGEPPEATLTSQLLAGNFSALLGGAYPILKAGEEWPRCQTCAARTPLVPYLQINLSSPHTPGPEFSAAAFSPVRPDGVTLFQVFLCIAPSPANSCIAASKTGA
ncbi:hypothetical protein FKP32DRAFT_1298385 [Trametes sanguinea]|nr:hypothetical protein FKP32DRAFT_1298385 [Trametes sanguinea]